MAEMESLELASLSPASSMRQRVRYSIGEAPTVSLNFSAKVERDMPARSANSCKVQRCAGSSCIAPIAAPICLSAKANSQPDAAARPFGKMQPQRLNQHHMGEMLGDQKS